MDARNERANKNGNAHQDDRTGRHDSDANPSPGRASDTIEATNWAAIRQLFQPLDVPTADRPDVKRGYFVVVPAGAGFEADVEGGDGNAGFSQQACTLALRLSGAFGSMFPFRTTHLNVA
jgi:hypothetical protein